MISVDKSIDINPEGTPDALILDREAVWGGLVKRPNMRRLMSRPSATATLSSATRPVSFAKLSSTEKRCASTSSSIR